MTTMPVPRTIASNLPANVVTLPLLVTTTMPVPPTIVCLPQVVSTLPSLAMIMISVLTIHVPHSPVVSTLGTHQRRPLVRSAYVILKQVGPCRILTATMVMLVLLTVAIPLPDFVNIPISVTMVMLVQVIVAIPPPELVVMSPKPVTILMLVRMTIAIRLPDVNMSP